MSDNTELNTAEEIDKKQHEFPIEDIPPKYIPSCCKEHTAQTLDRLKEEIRNTKCIGNLYNAQNFRKHVLKLIEEVSDE